MDFSKLEESEHQDFISYMQESVTKDQLEKIAEEKNCTLLVPKPNELFIDIDSLDALDEYRKRLQVLRDNDIDHNVRMLTSKSGNKHIIITLPFEVSDELRVAFQAALGSDPKRELLACLRILAKVEVVTVLFRPKEEV